MISNQFTLIIDDLRVKTRPAFLHYGKGDFSEAVESVEQLLRDLPATAGSAEEHEVADCYLNFLLLNLKLARDGTWDCERVRAFAEDLTQERSTAYGNHKRISILLQLKAHAGDACDCSMDESEFRRLLGDGQLLEFSPNLWDAVGLWAFRNNLMEPLGEAFESQTINPSRSMPQEAWQRINLMYQLRSGRAAQRDVREYIKLLRLVPQVLEFRHVILPVIEELGLWNAELETLVAQKLEIALRGDYDYPTERRTGRIRS